MNTNIQHLHHAEQGSSFSYHDEHICTMHLVEHIKCLTVPPGISTVEVIEKHTVHFPASVGGLEVARSVLEVMQQVVDEIEMLMAQQAEGDSAHA